MDKQRQFFVSGATRPSSFRIEQLKKLKSLLIQHETEIAAAIYQDLHKSPVETAIHEIMLLIEEINFVIKHLKKWTSVQKVSTPFPLLWPGRSAIYHEPYGKVLIIGPWNYPCLLIISPLIGAISAGNCVTIKPSELAPHTQALMVKLIQQYFPPHYIQAIAGGVEEAQSLLKERWDYIFFTGGSQIGKIVMEAAAKQLTPVTLELGGKSPCLVDTTASLDYAARRIAWAKTTNAGQVCIAPDYLYVHQDKKTALVLKIQQAIEQFYGKHVRESPHYGRIINKKHYNRLMKFLQRGNILYGGESNEAECYIAPTLIDGLSIDDPIMQEEIFGPLLPIFTYNKIEEVIEVVQAKPKPLALYLFTQDKAMEKKILGELSFGGGCVNDCIVQIANLHLPFGGVGSSGLGAYHGQYSFDTFSHQKAVYKKSFPIDFRLEYPPYSAKKLWWLKQLLKL